MTTAGFKHKIAGMMPRDAKPKPCVRKPGDRGFAPPSKERCPRCGSTDIRQTTIYDYPFFFCDDCRNDWLRKV
jgi:hypothetical protein